MKKLIILLLLACSLFLASAFDGHGKADAAIWTWTGVATSAGKYTPTLHFYQIKVSFQNWGCAEADHYLPGFLFQEGEGWCNLPPGFPVQSFTYNVGSANASFFKIYCWQFCWASPTVGVTAWYNP
jgi:hypothetical protein